MQLMNVDLIPDDERQDGDGRCQITVRHTDGSRQTLYASDAPGIDAADDCFFGYVV